MTASADWLEHAARMFEPRATTASQWTTPGELAVRLNPRTVRTPALDLIDNALVQAFQTEDSRLIVSMPPQEGKSVRVAGDFPTWWLSQRPESRGVIGSYGQALANRNGRQIRRRIQEHSELLGISIAPDNGAVHDWTIAGQDGGILSVGVGAGLTGRPADFLIIDDPIKDRAEADSQTYRERVWDWWTDTASARLAPGAPVIIILTRWHHDDLAGRLLAEQGGGRTYDATDGLVPFEWTYLNIPARADHRPERGEVDALGRQPEEYMVSARGRTREQWEQREKAAGPRTWASLYQGRPTPESGGLFPEEWATYDHPFHHVQDDGTNWVPGGERFEIIQSWDLTFKDTKGSDYVVGQVWLRQGHTVYLLDMIRARMSFNDTVNAIRTMTARWPQAHAKFVEDKANGPAVISALQSTIPGLIPVEPEGSKYARAAAISPFVWSQNVVIPTVELLPNVADLMVEAGAFPAHAHDDTVDSMSQAVNRLLLHPLVPLEDDTLTSDDIVNGMDPHAFLGGY